ncbi:hypothetical protein HK100_012537 [Physocladia obscura]|uniref:C2H2-type domain-containing protein n=1 Tax=Physocladia obscura TaxID=109957 RepID=A0AAD5XHK0_9FUNG|nr:hypothetical protein HK100_012537 [Physocladia obscura]
MDTDGKLPSFRDLVAAVAWQTTDSSPQRDQTLSQKQPQELQQLQSEYRQLSANTNSTLSMLSSSPSANAAPLNPRAVVSHLPPVNATVLASRSSPISQAVSPPQPLPQTAVHYSDDAFIVSSDGKIANYATFRFDNNISNNNLHDSQKQVLYPSTQQPHDTTNFRMQIDGYLNIEQDQFRPEATLCERDHISITSDIITQTCNENGEINSSTTTPPILMETSHRQPRRASNSNTSATSSVSSKAATPEDPSSLRTYSCSFPGCNKTFAYLSILKVHTRVHTRDRPHACPICPATYTTSSRLKIHTRSHTNEAPYTCPVATCTKRFKSNSNLAQHARVHMDKRAREAFERANRRTVVCSVCGNLYKTEKSMDQHYWREHADHAPNAPNGGSTAGGSGTSAVVSDCGSNQIE